MMLASEEISFTVSRIPGTLSRIRRKRRVEGGRQGRREGKERVEEEGTIKKKKTKKMKHMNSKKDIKNFKRATKDQIIRC